MLSLDRYATVKHPRFTQLRQRQYLPSVLACISWIGAAILCIPFLLVYKVTISSTSIPSSTSSRSPTTTMPFHDDSVINDKKLCVSDYGSDEWHIVFIVSYVGFAFIVPCFGIIFNHLGQRIKLESQSHFNWCVFSLSLQVFGENCAHFRLRHVPSTASCHCRCRPYFGVPHTWSSSPVWLRMASTCPNRHTTSFLVHNAAAFGTATEAKAISAVYIDLIAIEDLMDRREAEWIH